MDRHERRCNVCSQDHRASAAATRPHYYFHPVELIIFCCPFQAVVNCAREMENFFEREGPHGAAGIPYCRIEVDDKASLVYDQLSDRSLGRSPLLTAVTFFFAAKSSACAALQYCHRVHTQCYQKRGPSAGALRHGPIQVAPYFTMRICISFF
jgi:hypothetical protein